MVSGHVFAIIPLPPLFHVILVICCAVAFYRVAEMQNTPGTLWAVLSVGVWLVTAITIPPPYLGPLLAEVGLLAALFVTNLVRDRR